MIYVEYFNKEGEPFCGFDSVFLLDGGNEPSIWIKDANEKAYRLRKVNNKIHRFKIKKGERFSSYNIILYKGKIDKTDWN